MPLERALELLKIERECISRANTCNRDCANCELVQDDKELLEMYDLTIGIMTYLTGGSSNEPKIS